MTPTPSDISGLPQQGEIIAGKYQIEDVLGQGGMGVVIAARHLTLRRRVAIKFLLPTSMRVHGARERFLREARAAAALQSEHVARVLDVGVLDNGTPYLVMEHLSGSDLGTTLRARGRLPVAEAVDIILQACAAIGEAHALGIVHRDLKPQNIFLAQRTVSVPIIKVLDFGLARSAEDDLDMAGERLTKTSLVVGTPYYMSPEQLQSLKYVDARTDLWALGVILYELLAGRRPFEGQSMVWVYEGIRTRPPAPLQLCQLGIPPELDAAVLRCLEKDPARRVQSVPELVQRLLPFAPTKSGFSAAHLPGATPAAPSAAPLPAGASVAPVSTSITVLEQATTRVDSGEKPQKQPRSRKAAFAAAATAMAVVGLLAGGSILRLTMARIEEPIEPLAPVNAAPVAETAKAAMAIAYSGIQAPIVPPPASASAHPPMRRPPPRPPSAGASSAQAANPAGEEVEQIKPTADRVEPWDR